MAAEEFLLDKWAQEFELTSDTVDALAQKGFNTKRTLAKLTNELIKTEFKKLPLGQLFMVQDACNSLRGSQPPAIPETASTGGGPPAVTTGSDSQAANTGASQVANTSGASQAVSLGDVAQATSTGANTGGGSLPGAPLSAEEVAAFLENGSSVLSGNYGKPCMFDPFQFELNGNSAKCTYRDIRDYISLVPKNAGAANSSASVQIGSQEFLLKDSKIPWELLNVTQYMEGSLKIMREMALHDKCSIGELVEYTNYLVKIATLGQCFDWPSVLKYDQAYRKAQAAGGFSWGADNAYLMQLFLKPDRPKTQQAPQSRKQAPGQSKARQCKYDPESGEQICLKWNSSKGCNFRGCKFSHKCSTCFSSAHPECTHPAKHAQSTRPTEPENP